MREDSLIAVFSYNKKSIRFINIQKSTIGWSLCINVNLTEGEQKMAVYYRKKTDPTFMRKVGDPHIVMYNPIRAGDPGYVFGWTFNDLLPRGGNPGDIRTSSIIRPPALGGQDIAMLRAKKREQSAAEEVMKREQLGLELEQKAQEEKKAELAETEIPTKEEEVPDESPENWRNWSKPKLIKYAADSLEVDIHFNTSRENVIKKIEEAMHYIEPTI